MSMKFFCLALFVANFLGCQHLAPATNAVGSGSSSTHYSKSDGPLPGSDGLDFRDVQVIDLAVQCGFTVDKVMLTTDAGKSWGDVTSVTDTGCDSTANLTESRSVRLASVRKWRKDFTYTDDGGKSWQSPKDLGRFENQGFNFSHVLYGWFLGSVLEPNKKERRVVLFSTADGGDSWNKIPLPAGSEKYVTTAWLRTNGSGILIADKIWQTTNGGGRWDIVNIPKYGIFGVPDNIEFFSNAVGIITSNQGGKYLLTKDGGSSWESRSAPDGSAFSRLIYIDADRVIGLDGRVFVSSNSGIDWTQVRDDGYASLHLDKSKSIIVLWGKKYEAVRLSDFLQSAATTPFPEFRRDRREHRDAPLL